MILYRAIEFSRLAFLIDDEHQVVWKDHKDSYSSEDAEFKNWWLLDTSFSDRSQMVKNLITRNDLFFEKSLDFNSKQGGRFNPEKSFGAIYASSCPTTASLEVLYHIFESSFGLYKSLKKSSDKLTTSFNIPVPNHLEVLIVVLEFEVKNINDAESVNICDNRETFIDLCQDLGFYRYIDSDFDEDFIFGNNYEITNIMGCNIHKEKESVILAPSARLDLELQKESGTNNYVIPEKIQKKLSPRLTGRYREYLYKLGMIEDEGRHPISVAVKGSTSSKSSFFIQSTPNRKNGRIKEFSQVDDASSDRRKYSREIRLQRFISGESLI